MPSGIGHECVLAVGCQGEITEPMTDTDFCRHPPGLDVDTADRSAVAVGDQEVVSPVWSHQGHGTAEVRHGVPGVGLIGCRNVLGGRREQGEDRQESV